jgi:hypothetical protein
LKAHVSNLSWVQANFKDRKYKMVENLQLAHPRFEWQILQLASQHATNSAVLTP